MVTEAKIEKPDGPDDEFCPRWQRPCSEVCKTCHFWMKVKSHDEKGKLKSIGYACADLVAAAGILNTAAEVRSAVIATQEVNNRVVDLHNGMARPNMQIVEQLKPILQAAGGIAPIAAPREDPKLIGRAPAAIVRDEYAEDGVETTPVEPGPPEKDHDKTDPDGGAP
ncbi:hypothetical protein [Methyloceanibacter caenitepidi]|uniref:Uncharacterized protein n=1 Tax=Methyloceanibacter caenitepidi TaxID=1384459 RepID=A0A0A8K318_9HYPH|nr:hypothetical protein [Methyloceanibacter caenitepidi]BAQ16902.1 hypothetical protein GL4_1446 [Methyloceanibacter caenitepidi]